MATSKVCVGESSRRRRSASLGIIISICHSLPFLLLAVLHVPVGVRSRYSATAALTVVVARTALRAGNGFGSCCSSSGYYRNTTTFFPQPDVRRRLEHLPPAPPQCQPTAVVKEAKD